MALQPPVRAYRMADADLSHKAANIKNCIVRDAADFATRNVNAAKIAAFSDLRDDFSNYPTDEELLGTTMAATEIKDTKRKTLEQSIRVIRNMADTQYHGHGLYNTFGFDDLTRQTDSQLVRLARRVGRVSATLQVDLSNQGFNIAHLSNLSTQTQAFDEAIEAVAQSVEDRDIKTQFRVKAGNTLYESMMQLAAIGKSIYEDTDEAKYNDYVVLDTAPPPPPASTD